MKWSSSFLRNKKTIFFVSTCLAVSQHIHKLVELCKLVMLGVMDELQGYLSSLGALGAMCRSINQNQG
jgi:hypothetical protein